MRSPLGDPLPPDIPSNTRAWPSHREIEPHEPRNIVLLVTHQIVLRIGWIFKTESVIMPAFLDTISGPGAGLLRGCMPVLNRVGQSVPPVFSADYLKAIPYKKRALAAFTALMSVPCIAISALWFTTGGQSRVWAPWLFLGLYFVFFVFNGLYHLSFGTVQGKLVSPTRRGLLLSVSTSVGTIPAMAFAAWLLPGWIEVPFPGFVYLFSFVAVCFCLSGLTAMLLFEPADTSDQKEESQSTLGQSENRGGLIETWRALRRDRNLRRLVIVAMLFGSCLIIFPHYQALARERLGLTGVHLMLWVVTQNAAVGIYSLFVGPLADVRGYRLTLRLLIFGSGIAPAFAISLPHLPGYMGANLFWIVFIPLGITPLVLRTLLNYTLEICEITEQPRYLSTVNLCLAVPFLFSPAVGWLVDHAGFELVFLSAVGLIMLGGLVTFFLDEPRLRARDGRTGAIGVGADE